MNPAENLLGVENYIILDYPEQNPVLHQPWPGDDWENTLATANLMVRMSEKGATNGRSLAGLSSVQVMLPGRAITYSERGLIRNFHALIDPVVTHTGPLSHVSVEGCFSLPTHHWYRVNRPLSGLIEHTINKNGDRETLSLRGYELCFCLHEIDHLNGILISDIGVKG